MIDKITNLTTGHYLLTTLNGTQHLLNLDGGYVVRHSLRGREWDRSELTRDGSPLRIGNYEGSIYSLWWNDNTQQMEKTFDIRLGARIYFANMDEWRLTSALQTIELAEG